MGLLELLEAISAFTSGFRKKIKYLGSEAFEDGDKVRVALNITDAGASLLGVTLTTDDSRDHKNKYFASLRLFF